MRRARTSISSSLRISTLDECNAFCKGLDFDFGLIATLYIRYAFVWILIEGILTDPSKEDSGFLGSLSFSYKSNVAVDDTLHKNLSHLITYLVCNGEVPNKVCQTIATFTKKQKRLRGTHIDVTTLEGNDYHCSKVNNASCVSPGLLTVIGLVGPPFLKSVLQNVCLKHNTLEQHFKKP